MANKHCLFPEDGIYSDAAPHTPAHATTTATTPSVDTASGSEKPGDASKGKKPRVLLTIPSKVVARAQGLAIFTTARAGFQVSGATGSGILIARLPDGSWSPPSGIQVHSVGAGFVIGLDIYDCVVVINTKEALEAFTRTRMSLGSDLAVTAGPWGAGGALDFGMPQQGQKDKDKAAADQSSHPTKLAPPGAQQQPQTQPQVTTGPETTSTATVSTPQGGSGSSKNRKPSPFREVIKSPVYSYVKSRGFYAGVQIDGTVVTERKDANAAFYGAAVSVDKIIRGEVPSHGPPGMWPVGAQALFEVLKGAEGWRGQQGQQSPHAHQSQFPQHGAGAGPLSPPATTTGYYHPPAAATPGVSGVSGVSTGMHNLNIGSSGAGPSSGFGSGPAPPPSGAPSAAASAKAAEAAAEAPNHPDPYSAAPPSYSEPTGAEELPPAYVEDGQYRPPADSKSGQH